MELDGMHVAVLAGEGVEDLEYWVTVMRLREAGAQVTSVGLARATVRGKNGLEVPVDVAVGDVDPDEVDGLVIPGGHMPDKLRRYPAVTDFVAAIHAAGKPIGIICHGGLIAISARIVAGRRSTGSLGIRDDLLNAGATWVDEAAFRDENLVWGRVVEDIPAFCGELVGAFAEHRRARPRPSSPAGRPPAARESVRRPGQVRGTGLGRRWPELSERLERGRHAARRRLQRLVGGAP